MPHVKLGHLNANATSQEIHPLPYGEVVRIGHSRRSHARRRVNRVIVGPGKFWENVDISVGIFVCEIFIQPFANRSSSASNDATSDVFLNTRN